MSECRSASVRGKSSRTMSECLSPQNDVRVPFRIPERCPSAFRTSPRLQAAASVPFSHQRTVQPAYSSASVQFISQSSSSASVCSGSASAQASVPFRPASVQASVPFRPAPFSPTFQPGPVFLFRPAFHQRSCSGQRSSSGQRLFRPACSFRPAFRSASVPFRPFHPVFRLWPAFRSASVPFRP
jgi:hypothetical protein